MSAREPGGALRYECAGLKHRYTGPACTVALTQLVNSTQRGLDSSAVPCVKRRSELGAIEFIHIRLSQKETCSRSICLLLRLLPRRMPVGRFSLRQTWNAWPLSTCYATRSRTWLPVLFDAEDQDLGGRAIAGPDTRPKRGGRSQTSAASVQSAHEATKPGGRSYLCPVPKGLTQRRTLYQLSLGFVGTIRSAPDNQRRRARK